jgi:large subunit ribosomal protein L21
MYALVEIAGKQYKAEKGSSLTVDRLSGDKGSKVEFSSVLMIGGSDSVKIGSPFVSNVTVKATVEDTFKDDKVLVFKYKNRKRYRKTHGHRQQYSVIKIDDIVGA